MQQVIDYFNPIRTSLENTTKSYKCQKVKELTQGQPGMGLWENDTNTNIQKLYLTLVHIYNRET